MSEKRYDVRICNCGSVHFIDYDDIDEALDFEEELLLICGSCGKATYIGADIFFEDDKKCYNMYSYCEDESITISENNFIIDEDNPKKPISKIIYDKGKKVYVKSGYPARLYTGIGFQDIWFTDFEKFKKKGITEEEINEIINDWMAKSTTVDMNQLIRDFTDEELKALSSYAISSFNWTDTKYETEFNTRRKNDGN